MKKELIAYSILTIVIALLLFFETDLFKDKAEHITKVIEVEAFEKLDIDLECDIFVSLGEEQKIVFEGPKKYLSKVETAMDNGVLKISCRPPGRLARLLDKTPAESTSVKVYINLTGNNQLLRPKKGNLISNEALQFMEESRSDQLSLHPGLAVLMSLLGNQLSYFNCG